MRLSAVRVELNIQGTLKFKCCTDLLLRQVSQVMYLHLAHQSIIYSIKITASKDLKNNNLDVKLN